MIILAPGTTVTFIDGRFFENIGTSDLIIEARTNSYKVSAREVKQEPIRRESKCDHCYSEIETDEMATFLNGMIICNPCMVRSWEQ